MARHKAEHWFCIPCLACAGLRASGGRLWVYEQHHCMHKKPYTKGLYEEIYTLLTEQ